MKNPYMGNPTKALPFKEGYQGGIKEVVEWIVESDIFPPYENKCEAYLVPPKDLEAKLKEWGIE